MLSHLNLLLIKVILFTPSIQKTLGLLFDILEAICNHLLIWLALQQFYLRFSILRASYTLIVLLEH